MAKLKQSMFREYDLRGEVNDEQLNEYTINIISKAYGTMLRQRNIGTAVVGYDYRQSSKWITETAVQGLVSTGVNVINLGMVLTPMMYFAQYYYGSKGGVMVTASHNPAGWSGFKLALDYSMTLGRKEVQEELYGLTVSEQFATGHGTVLDDEEERDRLRSAYTADLIKRVNIARPIKVVVNAGNGTPGPIVPDILREAGCEVIELHCNKDWSFPHYFPNPSSVEMMDDTGEKTVESGADIGFAFDGDGDRLGVTDEQGKVVWSDRYLILLARQTLENHPGAKIVFDVKCSQALPEDIEARGGTPIMWKTGHSYIKQKLWEEKAPLGGEMSGHIFFGEPDYYGFDDAVFAALKLAEYLSHRKQSISSSIDETPYYVSTPALQVKCPVDKGWFHRQLAKIWDVLGWDTSKWVYDETIKYEVVDKLTKEFKDEGYDVIDINGARVNFGDGWGLVRASSNLPVLGMRFEARTEDRVKEIMSIFRNKFAKYPEIDSEWESG